MQYLEELRKKGSLLLGLAFALLLVVGTACGTAAQEEVTAPAATQPAAVSSGSSIQPTAMPQATTAPSMDAMSAEVHPGKVVWMFPSLGNERFDEAHWAGGTKNFARFVHAMLIAGNEHGEMLPGLSNKWGVSEDGHSWWFDFDILESGDAVKFHDGSPMTIEDVMWTFEHAMGKGIVEHATNTYLPDLAMRTDSITQTGPNQMTIKFSFVNAGYDLISLSELGASTRGVVPKRQDVWNIKMEQDFDNAPVMAGQMSFVDHTRAERLSLERFDDYFYQPANGFPEDRRMKFTFLDMLIVPEEATRAAALRSGEADIAPVTLESRELVEEGGGRIIFTPEGVYWWVMFPQNWAEGPTPDYPNWKPSPFADKRVRQALAYAIDKELMMERLYGGPEVAVVKGWAQVTPGTLGYSSDLDPLPHDPAKARALLTEAGYPNGEGFGKVILNTWHSPSLPLLPESAQVGADFWEKELGLDVEVRVGDSTSLRKAYRAGDLQGQILWRENETKADGMGSTRGYYGLEGPVMPFHQDPDLFKMTLGTLAVYEPEARVKAINDLYKVLWEEHHALGIGFVNIPWGVGSRIKAWHPWPRCEFPCGRYTITLHP